MNRKHSLLSLLVLSGLGLTSAMAIADPISSSLTVTCPSTQLSSNMLTNFGGYVAGYGVEYIASQALNVYFVSQSLPYNVPSGLTDYFNEAVSYDSTTGYIACSYQSNLSGNPFFSVIYALTNGKGGAVTAQTNNTISLNVPMGLKG